MDFKINYLKQKNNILCTANAAFVMRFQKRNLDGITYRFFVTLYYDHMEKKVIINILTQHQL